MGCHVSFSRGSSQLRDQTQVSCIGRRIRYLGSPSAAQTDSSIGLAFAKHLLHKGNYYYYKHMVHLVGNLVTLPSQSSNASRQGACPTPCDPVACSPPGSSVHGILQARILEWIAMPFSRGSSCPICTCYSLSH